LTRLASACTDRSIPALIGPATAAWSACENGSAWPHRAPNVFPNRSSHEEGRSLRG